MKHTHPEEISSLLIFPIMALLYLIAISLTYFISKITIDKISYKGKTVLFKGKFGKYLGIVFLDFFLTIITLGIYMAWFINDLHRFYIDNSSYDSNDFKFHGKGEKLFVILLLTLFIPIMIFAIVMAIYMIKSPDKVSVITILYQLFMAIIMIPYMYLFYKWMVNVTYKDYHISWNTTFWNSCGKIALEMILTIITIGIYSPLAGVRLYHYFAAKTMVVSTERKLKFGYDIDSLNDFLMIWGQLLLTIITMGIYYPWAFSKIGNRILSKTYLEIVSEPSNVLV